MWPFTGSHRSLLSSSPSRTLLSLEMKGILSFCQEQFLISWLEVTLQTETSPSLSVELQSGPRNEWATRTNLSAAPFISEKGERDPDLYGPACHTEKVIASFYQWWVIMKTTEHLEENWFGKSSRFPVLPSSLVPMQQLLTTSLVMATSPTAQLGEELRQMLSKLF